MKHYFAYLLLIISISCTHQNTVVVNLRLKNAKGIIAYFEELKLSGSTFIDSVRIGRNGRARFTAKQKSEGFYRVYFKDGKSLNFMLAGGEKATVKADFNDFYRTKQFDGPISAIKLNGIYDTLRVAQDRLTEIKKDFQAMDLRSETEKTEAKVLADEFNTIRGKIHRHSIQHLLDDPSSLLNVAILNQTYFPGDYVFGEARDLQFYKIISDTLMKYYPNNKHVKQLKTNYLQLYSNYKREMFLRAAKPMDSNIPDLVLPNANGSKTSLSSLKGKIVLLSFWASYHNESIKHLLDLKQLYRKYKNRGFEIYQVSLDSSLNVWKKALYFEEIKWTSVCDTSFAESSTRAMYNVNELPLHYLINREQNTIIGRNLSFIELQNKLSILLN